MFYVVVCNRIHEFFTRDNAERFYASAEAEGLEPFATTYREVAEEMVY